MEKPQPKNKLVFYMLMFVVGVFFLLSFEAVLYLGSWLFMYLWP